MSWLVSLTVAGAVPEWPRWRRCHAVSPASRFNPWTTVRGSPRSARSLCERARLRKTSVVGVVVDRIEQRDAAFVAGVVVRHHRGRPRTRRGTSARRRQQRDLAFGLGDEFAASRLGHFLPVA